MALLVPPPFYPCDPRTVVLSLISAVLCFVGWYFSSFCDVDVGVGLVKLEGLASRTHARSLTD